MKGKWHFVKSMLGVGLALLLCIICFSAPVAAQAAVKTGTCGENLTWVFDEATATLTISGEGAMEDYASSSSVPWYSFRSEINNVVIEDGVTSIGEPAFYNCSSLT